MQGKSLWIFLLGVQLHYAINQEIKFVELRFEELERVRNITAHNGFLPNSEDFQRVILSFKDWCRQTTNIQ